MSRSVKGGAVRLSRLITGLGALATFAAAVSPAAASTYQIYGEGDDYFTLPPYTFQEGAFGTTANVPVSNSVSRDSSGSYPGQYATNQDEFAAADQFGAHVSTTARALFTYGRGTADEYFKYESSASAIVTITDFIITGPQAASTVATAVHLDLDGSLVAAAELDGGSKGMSASTSVSANLSFNSTALNSGSASAGSTNGSAPSYGSSGWLSGYSGGSTTLTSATFNAPVNTPFTLQFELSADSVALSNEDDTGLMTANTDFGDTFGFASGQPVLALPAGYTADSPSAGIVADQYVALPEPTAVVVLAGLLLSPTKLLRRRRR